jgi:hypothetical protein
MVYGNNNIIFILNKERKVFMHYYSILIQFAKPDAPKFTEIEELINDAVKVYNSKSLMAINPKKIVEKNFKDNMTLELILESTQELPESSASKSLRVFSKYLIENNMRPYITGKRLFKMIPKKLNDYNIKEKNGINKKENEIKEMSNLPESSYKEKIEQLGYTKRIEDKLDLIYSTLISTLINLEIKDCDCGLPKED